MTLDQNFIGIDISKAWLDLFEARGDRHSRVANRPDDIAQWAAGLAADSVIVFEATGRYDTALRETLDRAGVGYVRVNPLRARDFARAMGQLAKTDSLDARMLARMGQALELRAQPAPGPDRLQLAALAQRRDQLVAIRAGETNHAHSAAPLLGPDIARHLAWLDAEIAAIEARIAALVATTAELDRDNGLLRTLPGMGPVGATTLLALMPELGHCSDKAIAALAGLAPLNRDSGTLRGSRHIGPGRRRVRKALYMAAVSAVRCSQRFKAAYLGLRERGKPAKLALIAIARKLLVVLNAMIRDQQPFRQ